jgi:hypothetical protein
MATPLYETPDLKKWNTFHQSYTLGKKHEFLRDGPAETILAYSEAGGDALRLRLVLWGLREAGYPRVVPDLPTLKAMQRLLRGVEAIPDMQELMHVDKSLWEEVTALTPLKGKLQAYLEWLPVKQKLHDMQRSIKEMTRPLKKLAVRAPEPKRPPRTRGYELKTLVAVALVEEFRRRFKTPSYHRAVILLRETLPDKDNVRDRLTVRGFGKLTGAKLGRLVRSVPEAIRKETHAQFFL